MTHMNTRAEQVSYSRKYNLANGEDNRDGIDHNISWNCGHEGVDGDVPPHVIDLRRRQMKNFMLALMVSRGSCQVRCMKRKC